MDMIDVAILTGAAALAGAWWWRVRRRNSAAYEMPTRGEVERWLRETATVGDMTIISALGLVTERELRYSRDDARLNALAMVYRASEPGGRHPQSVAIVEEIRRRLQTDPAFAAAVDAVETDIAQP